MARDRRPPRRRPLGRRASTSTSTGRWEYTVEAWTDVFGTWRDELERKVAAGQHDLAGELSEGVLLLERREGRRRRRRRGARSSTPSRRSPTTTCPRPPSTTSRSDRSCSPPSSASQPTATARHPRRAAPARGRPRARPVRRLVRAVPALLGRPRRRRGAAPAARRARLRRPLPPADPPDRPDQPQGPQQRPRPPARTTPAAPGRSATQSGGHDAVHPDSARSTTSTRSSPARREHDIEIALDFAIQCSADHPWLHEHPEWFHRRPDGTLKYAENPPKRYQDIYNVDFDSPDWRGLWEALLDVVLHWVDARRAGVPRRQPAHQAVRRSGSG